MQIQATLLDRPIEVATSPAASALGVARLAAERLGVATPRADPGYRVTPESNLQSPDTGAARRAWRQAIARSRGMSVSQTEPAPGDEIERNNE
jgi:hypothetical protein